MSLNPRYPGVYIQELESPVHTIVGVSTSVTAFIGRAPAGIRDKATIVHNWKEYSGIFGDLSKDSNMSYAVRQYFQNSPENATAIIVAIDDGTPHAIYDRKIDGNGKEVTGKHLEFEAYSPGETGKTLSIYVERNELVEEKNRLNLYVKGPFDIELPGDRDKKKDALLKWHLRQSATFESFYNLSLEPEDNNYLERGLGSSQYIRIHHPKSPIKQTKSLDEVTGLYQTEPNAKLVATPNKKIYDENIIPTDSKDIEAKKGIYALDDVEIFNMLCIPPFADDDGDVPIEIYKEAAKYCQNKRAILIIDPAKSWTKYSDPLNSDVKKFEDLKLRDKNSVVYFPRIKFPDPKEGGRIKEFVPCGAIAGIIARTDRDRGVWKAPAGVQATIEGAADLSIRMTDNENGDLNPVGINCLRVKPPYGIVVWGARTTRGADQLTDQWKYLPVRRVALYIEESLYRGTQWVVFEPNDEPLWSQIRLNITAFMQDLFLKGAFQGSSPKEAYLVKCDKETTTQTDIDRGIVNIVVGFAPLKPAEFVVIQIKQLAGQTAVGGGV